MAAVQAAIINMKRAEAIYYIEFIAVVNLLFWRGYSLYFKFEIHYYTISPNLSPRQAGVSIIFLKFTNIKDESKNLKTTGKQIKESTISLLYTSMKRSL